MYIPYQEHNINDKNRKINDYCFYNIILLYYILTRSCIAAIRLF